MFVMNQQKLDKAAADLLFKITDLSLQLSEALDTLSTEIPNDYSILNEEIESNCDLNLGDLKSILKAITHF
jgi:hypothetical protein